jgi:hypothetical protein
MPRGVPVSGKRQPRAVPAVTETAETTLASSALDDEARIDEAFGNEVEAADFPAEGELIEEYQLDPEPVWSAEKVQLISQPPADAPEQTPEQQEIAYLKDQLARLGGKKDVEPQPEELQRPGDDGNILIHFLEDGLTLLGKVWYRGEELEFEVGSQAYKDTFNRRGETWLDLRNDEFGQVDRWGKIMFRNGRWPGKTYADGTFEALRLEKGDGSVKPPTATELAAAEKARQRRAAPRLPTLAQ